MKKKYQKILCLLTASLLLFLSPVASLMDVTNMTQVEATSAGIPAGMELFTFLMNLFGVSVVGQGQSEQAKRYNEYLDYLQSVGDTKTYDALTAYTSGSGATITSGMLDTVKSYTKEKLGNISSGKIQYVYDGYTYCNGTLSAIDSTILSNYVKQNSNYYTFLVRTNKTNSSGERNAYDTKVDSNVLSGGVLGLQTYLVCLPGNYELFQYLTYDSDGNYVSTQSPRFFECSLKDDGRLSIASMGVSYGGSGPFSKEILSGVSFLCTNVPYVAFNGSTRPSTVSELLSGSTLKSSQAKSMASWGAYNEKLLEKLIDKVISAKAIGNLNTSVSDVITANTVTDEVTGDITYTDNIADVVQAAVKKALDDAGIDGWEVIEGGGGTTENPDPGENEDAKYPWLPDLSNKIGSVEETFNNGLKSIADAIASGFNTLWGWLKNILEAIQTGFIQLWDWLGKILDAIKAIPENAKELWKANAPILWEWLGKIGDYIQAIPGAVADFWADFQPTLWKWLGDIKDAIFLIPAAIGEIIGDIADLISPLWDTLFQWLGKILNAITSLPQTIADLILSGLEKLFVPDLADVQPELEVINSKFGWMGNLYAAFKTNLTTLNPDAEPPVIYIDFTKSESSKYVPVGKQLAIDFSWYAKYKPAGDKIISAFMWIGYLWFTFKRLPDIISGGGAVRVDELRYEDAMEKKAKREAKAQKKGGRP